MAGWDDLLLDCHPALLGGGLEIEGLAENCTWHVDVEVTDDAGAPIDWAAAGITGEGFIYSTRDGGTKIADWVIDLSGPGHIVASVDKADTAGLATPTAGHAIFLIKLGTPDQRIPLCLPFNSPCPIRSED